MTEQLSPEQRDEVRRLAQDAVYQLLVPTRAVAVAANLLAAGIDSPAVTALACMPAAEADLRIDDVSPLVLRMAEDLNVPFPRLDQGAWPQVRQLSEAILHDDISPGHGARLVWQYWNECGQPAELAAMLMLEDEWEGAVGDDRKAVEDQIVMHARELIRAADRYLAEHD